MVIASLRVFVIRSITGIGTHAMRFVEALQRCSDFLPLKLEIVDASDPTEVSAAIFRSTPSDINLVFLPENYCDHLRGIVIYWVVFESSRPPAPYPSPDTFDYFVCASQWGASCFKSYGVPSERLWVVPEGVDSEVYHPLGRTPNSPMKRRFLMVGKFERRKGYREAFQAFEIAWRENKNMELVVKADWVSASGSQHHPGFLELAREFAHLPIVVCGGIASVDSMRSLYQSADYFLFPSLGEGWGLPLIEAISCGCYAISCNYSGQSEFLKEIDGLFSAIPYRLIPVDCPDFIRAYSHVDGDNGKWAQPDIGALAQIITRCAISPLVHHALLASEIVRRRFHWDNSVHVFSQFLLTQVIPRQHVESSQVFA